MRFTIIYLGHTPASMLDRFDKYPNQFQSLLTPAFSREVSFDQVRVIEGEPVPDPANLDGIIISGSAYGVYDEVEWMEPMRRFVRKAYDLGKPMLGVCFGHQIIADALGGKVVKSEKGWSLGRHVYVVDREALGLPEEPHDIALAASHQDQVVEPPKIATPFLKSDFTPVAGLVYDNKATITVQPHPEFNHDYARALCRLRLNDPYPENYVVELERTLDEPLERNLMGQLIADFLTKAA
ncbi:MAG: type 1 glutamine amidotransferase [Hyphomicrobiaceae bacterium]|nr:type 1 glutamine amidotransferase [Hyphomicrobiaceae bacterium]